MGAAFPLNSPRMPATNSTASWLERADRLRVAPEIVGPVRMGFPGLRVEHEPCADIRASVGKPRK